MIKPSSGGFDMEKCNCKICIARKQYPTWHDAFERIKELESDLTTFIDETNRLTVIKKELEQELEKKNKFINGMVAEFQDDFGDKPEKLIPYLKQELERYKEFFKSVRTDVVGWHDCPEKDMNYNLDTLLSLCYLIKEFEEAKE